MNKTDIPLFGDIDPVTGHIVTTSFTSIQQMLRARYPVDETVPEPVRERLLMAVDYLALAYEQANAGRVYLFTELTNDAALNVSLAVELALKQRLALRSHFAILIKKAREDGILPVSGPDKEFLDLIQQNRNAIIHGDPEQQSFGPMVGVQIGIIIAAVNAIFSPGETKSL